MTSYFKYHKAWRFDGAPHEETLLKKKEWKSFLKQGGVLVRNTYDFDCQNNTCFWNLIKDSFGGLEELSSNTRKKVRRSLEHFEFKLVDAQLIKDHGYPILKATYDDYAVVDYAMNPSVFHEMMELFESSPYEYWGAFDRDTGDLVGFCVNRIWKEACGYETIAFLPKYKRKSTSYPYYGFYYSINRYYLQEKGLRYVTSGTRSITEHSNIQPFLEEKFHFRKSYCKLAIYYKWWMKMAVNVLYPFRKIITLPRIKAILNMEAMQRGEK